MERKEILNKIETGIKEVFTSEKYLNYLKFLSNFHSYSVNNSILIFSQNPEASIVAGFNKWKKLKRNVKKGEKSIKILAPLIKKIKNDEDEEESVINGFRIVSVFDVSQTEGEDLPTLCDELTEEVKEYETLFNKIKSITSLPIEFKPLENCKGYYSPDENKIAIKEGMSESQTIKTLVHELAHSILHKDTKKSRATAEVEAESVAYVVCNQLGIDTSDYSFEYLATWSSGQDVKELKGSLSIIQKTADKIIKKLYKKVP